jgi:phenylalanyl-tRNA synthetase alpha chain
VTGGEEPKPTHQAIAERLHDFEREAAEVRERQAWQELRLRWLGRKRGLVRELLGRIQEIDPAERREYGRDVNRLKDRVEHRLAELDNELSERERAEGESLAAVDVTLPGRRPMIGSTHPVNLVVREIVEIFSSLGYSVADGPEVEDDFHNFEALNFPPDHPARDEQDTFFLTDGRLLRTHTSPVQIRTMLTPGRRPPIRIICPGRVYRNDNDLRHSPVFHQVEGLAVGKGITFADLKGTLEAFLRRLFSPQSGVRLRPGYFPFTEPSAEVDITCPFCGGQGCRVCSDTGWMEILGSGMVNPRVLEVCGIDPKIYTGFAFGLGTDRVAMIKYRIPNIRLLFESDERLLRQVRS